MEMKPREKATRARLTEREKRDEADAETDAGKRSLALHSKGRRSAGGREEESERSKERERETVCLCWRRLSRQIANSKRGRDECEGREQQTSCGGRTHLVSLEGMRAAECL